MKNIRLIKINEEIKSLVSGIVRNELNDPRITGLITITKVDTDNDLYQANTYVSIYGAKDEKQSFDALVRSAGYIRKILSKTMKLRTVPIIKFIVDKNLDYSENIDKILSTIEIPDDENQD